MGESYVVGPDSVQNIVGQASSVAASGATTVGQFGSSVLDGASLAGIGSAVASANATLQANLTSTMNSSLSQIKSVFGLSGYVSEEYAALDRYIAAQYNSLSTLLNSHPMANTPPHKGPGGPGNEGPLPAHGVASPNLSDYKTEAEMKAAVEYFRLKGWNTAGDALQHYLDNTGTDFIVSPHQMMQDMPKFNTTVNNVLTANQGNGPFDTGWQNTDDIVPKAGSTRGIPESDDWYYTADNFRYRVSGLSTVQPDGSTTTNYSVDVYKPYIFGSPRSPITVPYVGGITGPLSQDSIQDLNTTGLAQNFNIVGSEHYSRTTPAPTP
jgi:hypothetical protein